DYLLVDCLLKQVVDPLRFGPDAAQVAHLCLDRERELMRRVAGQADCFSIRTFDQYSHYAASFRLCNCSTAYMKKPPEEAVAFPPAADREINSPRHILITQIRRPFHCHRRTG